MYTCIFTTDQLPVTLITPSLIFNMMSKEVSVLPSLVCFAGQPDSGQEKALQQFLHFTKDPINSAGFSSYHILATTISIYPRFTHATIPAEFYMFGTQSGISKHAQQYSVDLGPQPFAKFHESLLNQHMNRLLCHLEKFNYNKFDSKDINAANSIQRRLSQIAKGTGLIKIWNVPIQCNVLHFLKRFSGCLQNNHMLLFAHLKNTLEQFKHWQPPFEFDDSTNDGKVKLWYSNLDYLLRSSRLCLSCKPQKVCQIFASSDDEVTIEQSLLEFGKEVKLATAKLRVDCLIKEEIVHFDTRTNQRSKFENFLRGIITANPKKIPLSWLFLRGALEEHTSIFMAKSDLKILAHSCGINDDKSFQEFCNFFTSFGSILDVSIVSNCANIIIIKPDEFISKLHHCFDDNPHEFVKKDGIITHQIASELLGNDELIFMKCLSDVGLVCTVPKGQFGDGKQEECFFMPTARKNQQCHFRNDEVVCLFFSKLLPPTFTIFEVAFTKHLLRKLPNARLQSAEYENVTVIEYENNSINITIRGIYKGNCIEIMISEVGSIQYNTHCIIAEVVKEIAVENTNEQLGEFKYQFAIPCVSKNMHHVLPGDEQCVDCCKDERRKTLLEKWSKAIIEVSIN